MGIILWHTYYLAMDQLAKHISKVFARGAGKNVILFRHAESLGNYSGTIIGWTDCKLTINGRKQAHSLYPSLRDYIPKFNGIYSSDLIRAFDTANISLGFNHTNEIKHDKRLRELHFGDEEGRHYDSLPETEKEIINAFTYAPKNGETWPNVRTRCLEFFQTLRSPGNYLVYTHGGLICTLTHSLGLKDCISHCSAVGLELDDKSEPKEILFYWVYPEELLS
eukprot:TRINITY_DN3110_c0_g1_i4.p1 TRINITY_DN3110_c0_g1~~TRINITY_DN3110_c0_g1_i4.p1  ORF type:complete len:222 (-),score=29.19 TRINITY_DN3110_c0_g1_i4:172-837(-)